MRSTSPPELMQQRSRVLFACNEAGELLRINEPEGTIAPRLYYGRYAGGMVCRFRHDLPATIRRRLLFLLEARSAADPDDAPSLLSAELLALLAEHAPVSRLEEGPAYWLPPPPPESDRPSPVADNAASTRIVHLTEENLHLLPDDFTETRRYLRERQPVVLCLLGGEVASYCISSRNTPDVCEAGLITFDAYRRRGYAHQVVRRWAQELYAQDKLPLYSTSWDNIASQGVAASLGAVAYGADLAVY